MRSSRRCSALKTKHSQQSSRETDSSAAAGRELANYRVQCIAAGTTRFLPSPLDFEAKAMAMISVDLETNKIQSITATMDRVGLLRRLGLCSLDD